MDKLARGEARLRLAHQLQVAHGIDPADIALLLSVPVSQYLNRLNLDCSSAAADSQVKTRDAILARAESRAWEILNGRPDAAASGSSGGGMAVSGA
ncbi:MAG TPA: hypothetical protein GXX48_25320 [Ochrobactrum intermedium]|uniref:Uncharacterized protein n=1 Tax=Brucella intermedia TaxID=94625 RepID=A0A7V6U2B3_9HYPH|nr:hypothetical protein [Brucella intermedia]HHV70920.1 hypothetical protein [Brucella intermedia]